LDGFGGGSQGTVTVTVTVSAGPGTVVVTAGADTVVVGPATVVVVVGPGTVTKIVMRGAGAIAPEPLLGVVGRARKVVVSVTICSPPGIVRVVVVHTTSWSALPTVPWAIVPIAPTPRRYATSRIKGAWRS